MSNQPKMQNCRTDFNVLLIGEITTVFYLSGIAEVAALTGVAYVLFPELAALAYDIFTRPNGTWATAPLMLVLTPVLTAVAGVLIAQYMPYGFASVLICISIAIGLIKLLHSPIAPAISAGLLPLALSETSWWYPLSIVFGTGLLAVLSVAYRKFFSTGQLPELPSDALDDLIEQPPMQYSWLPFFMIFLLVSIYLAETTGLRLILFPPLVVIGFEMFAHFDVCPWADKPLLLPLACTLTATAGVAMISIFGNDPLAAILAVMIGVTIVRLFKLHAPPALAVGLLPFVIEHPNYWYIVSVGVGTSLLTMIFISFRWMTVKQVK